MVPADVDAIAAMADVAAFAVPVAAAKGAISALIVFAAFLALSAVVTAKALVARLACAAVPVIAAFGGVACSLPAFATFSALVVPATGILWDAIAIATALVLRTAVSAARVLGRTDLQVGGLYQLWRRGGRGALIWRWILGRCPVRACGDRSPADQASK